MSRLESKLNELKNQGRKALNIYITAGAPDVETSKRAIIEATKAGADIIEIGIPFSDPLADGPVIQASSTAAIKNRMSPYRVVSIIKELRKNIDNPLIGMGYINSLMSYGYRYGNDYNGFERFVTEAKIAGMDGLIIPDVPHEESTQIKATSRRKGIHLIEFVTPLTTIERMESTCKDATGFIYCVSNTGVTGVKELDFSKIGEVTNQAREFTQTPLMIGFGIGTPQAAANAAKFADGVIVGSAVVKRLQENKFDEAMDLIHSMRVALDQSK